MNVPNSPDVLSVLLIGFASMVWSTALEYIVLEVLCSSVWLFDIVEDPGTP